MADGFLHSTIRSQALLGEKHGWSRQERQNSNLKTAMSLAVKQP